MSGQLTKQFKNKIIDTVNQYNRLHDKQIQGWIAVDASGEVYKFEHKPETIMTDKVWINADPSYRYIGCIDKFDSTRWTKAIIHTDDIYNNPSLILKVWKPGSQTLVIQIQKASDIPFDGVNLVKSRGYNYVDGLYKNRAVIYINPSNLNKDMVMVYPNAADREKALLDLIQTLEGYYQGIKRTTENDSVIYTFYK